MPTRRQSDECVILERIHQQLQRQGETLQALLNREHEIFRLLKHPQKVTGFKFFLGVTAMSNQALAGLAPGTSGTVSIQPVDSNGNVATLPSGIVPLWTRSNTQTTVTPAADGLSAQVSVDKQAATDADATITVAYPDGSVTSTCGFPVDPNPVPPVGAVAGFSFSQSDPAPAAS